VKPVPRAEQFPQFQDLGGFYSQCRVHESDHFIVLPVKSWVEAGGPSFAFQVNQGGADLCLKPRLESQGWDSSQLFPDGGDLQPWPTDETAGESLNMLSVSVGTPFHWRHQIPIFRFSTMVYTFVLEGDHEGEIWRYLISPDAWDPLRAAPSLAALFTQWTRGIAAGVVYYSELHRCLIVGDPTIPVTFDELWQRAPNLDPAAFPNDLPEPLLRERQRECGVDLDCIDRGFECWQELLDDTLAVRTSLGV